MEFLAAIGAVALINSILFSTEAVKAHAVAPIGHHYKVCVANKLSNDCDKYANQREGLSLEMDVNGKRYPVHGSELESPHSHR